MKPKNSEKFAERKVIKYFAIGAGMAYVIVPLVFATFIVLTDFFVHPERKLYLNAVLRFVGALYVFFIPLPFFLFLGAFITYRRKKK